MLSSVSKTARYLAVFLLLLTGLAARQSALAQSAPSIRGFVVGAEFTQFINGYAAQPLGQGTNWWFGYRPDIPQDPTTHAEVPVTYGGNSVTNGGYPNGDDWPLPTNHIVYTTSGLPAVDLFNHQTIYSKNTGAYPGVSALNITASGVIGNETITANAKHWGGFYGTLRGSNGVKQLQGAPWSSAGSDYGYFDAGYSGYVQFAPGPAAINFYIYDIAGSTPTTDAQSHLTYDLTSAPDNTSATTNKARGRLTLRRKDFGARWEYGIDPNAKQYANTFIIQGVWQIAAVEGSFTSVYSTSDIGKGVGTYGQPDRFFAGLNFNDFNFYNVVANGVNTEKSTVYQFLTATLAVARTYNACTNQICDTVTNTGDVALDNIILTDTQAAVSQAPFALQPGASLQVCSTPTAAYAPGGTATAVSSRFNIERAQDLTGSTGTLADTTTNVSGTPDAPVITATAVSSSTQMVACASITGNVSYKPSLSTTTGTPVATVTVTLTGTDANGKAVSLVTTTDSKGNYTFANLVPGTYTITETVPAGYTALAAVAGDSAAVVSSTVLTVTATKSGTSTYNNENFLLTKTGSLSGVAYSDLNNNGKYDSGEPLLAGVTITLTKPDGTKATTTTDANGKYSFTNLTAGTYTVTAPGTASGLSLSTSATLTVSVTAGQDTPNNNFGYTKPVGSICGTVYTDNCNTGKQGSGNAGIAGVVVKLIDGNHNVIATTTTDCNGKYTFTGIAPGTYWVQVPSTFNGLKVYGYSDTTVVTAGQCTTKDFRYYAPASIGGCVYTHLYCDCYAALSGVTVTLKDGNGCVVATTCTDCNGCYSFCNLTPGGYTVETPCNVCWFKVVTCDPLCVNACGGQKADCNNFGYDWCW